MEIQRGVLFIELSFTMRKCGHGCQGGFPQKLVQGDFTVGANIPLESLVPQMVYTCHQ